MNDYITKIDNFIRPLAKVEGLSLARVGGSVRDELLGRRVKDADYVAFGVSLQELGDYLTGFALGVGGCSITPLKLRDGRQAGWRVFKKGHGLIEIMLPRREISTGTGHRDFFIALDASLTPEEDALRRDFTFNALYKWLEPETRTTIVHNGGRMILENITDPTGRGLYDLQHKLVNTTHPDSFRDDPLRTLRALRFVSVLGYDLGVQTHAQMKEHADAVSGLNFQNNTSGTVLDEMSKLLMGDDAGKALRLMRDTGVMAHLFPELAPMIGHDPNSNYHDLTTDEHTIRAIEAAVKADASLMVRWALLFHDSGKPEVEWVGVDGRKHYYAAKIPHPMWSGTAGPQVGELETIPLRTITTEDHEVASERRWHAFCARANVPKELRKGAALIIREHMVTVQPRNVRVKVARMRVKWGDQMTHRILLHRVCDLMGKNKTSKASIGYVGEQELIREELALSGVPLAAKDLMIAGGDVVALGVKGREVGTVLAGVLDEVVCQPNEQKLSREWQLEAAGRHVRKVRRDLRHL